MSQVGLSNTNLLGDPVTVPHGGTGRTTLTDHAFLIGAGVSPVNFLGPGTDGQIPIGSTGITPILATITAGAGITVTNGAGSITIASTAGGFTWNIVAAASQALAAENGYINTNVGLTTFTLPAVTIVGDTYQIAGNSAGGWRVAQNAGQQIHYGSVSTTVGVAGQLDSTSAHDCIEILCITANTTFIILDSVGTITVT